MKKLTGKTIDFVTRMKNMTHAKSLRNIWHAQSAGIIVSFMSLGPGRSLFAGAIRKRLTDLQHTGNVHEIISR